MKMLVESYGNIKQKDERGFEHVVSEECSL